MGSKKHKKHKSEKRERYEEKQFGVDKPALKLILKVNNSTPEHSNDASGPLAVPQTLTHAGGLGIGSVPADEESRHSAASVQIKEESHIDKQHKKAKKKKKKKEKDKDREKHEKKHKHHHKEKRKRPRDESSQEDVSMGEESLSEPPSNKRMLLEGNVTAQKSMGEVQHSGQGLGNEQSGQVRGQAPVVSREPRSCVLRQRQERSALQKLLDYLLKGLEKRDPQQFFAWPVTDHIAPGYSQIIQNPMDFSTMKQKIDDNLYSTLHEFIEDFKLMCNNAMVYNHPDTIYYKAAKKLLHVGVKMMCPDKLKPLRGVLVYMSELSREELGFDLGFEESSMSTCTQNTSVESIENGVSVNDEDSDASKENKHKIKENSRPLNKFEAIPDEMTPEEILEQAQKAAQAAADRLSMKRVNTKMGFLRQNKDGSTSLAILVPNDGVTPGSNERPISLGMLSGKLSHGTGQLQGFREDRRNIAKGVKPLYYGAFGSYAPSYDSTFANLTKEETELIYQTYGDETAVQYAESILDFAKDNDYTLTMVDNLLDLLTSGEHSKTKKILEERRKLREEEEKIKQLLEGKVNNSHPVNNENVPPLKEKKVDIGQLKTIKDFGLDTCFLDVLERSFYSTEQKAGDEAMQCQLEQTSSLIQKLQQVQNDRLSLPPPVHLSQVPHASDGEVHLADKITESLKDMAKKLPPASVAPVPSIRKAMGILPSEIVPPSVHLEKVPTAIRSQQAVNQTSAVMMDVDNVVQSALTQQTSGSEMPVIVSEPLASGHVMDVDVAGTSSHAGHNEASVNLVPDLESELREFLESEPALSNSPLHDDKTIEEILSES